MIIDKKKLDDLTEKAKSSSRLRMNYNFHKSLDDKCHRMLNAVEHAERYTNTSSSYQRRIVLHT
jgi:cupin fold WbuC family metalloprotein